MAAQSKKPFRAILTPHRSLAPTGFLILMGVLVALNLTAGVGFYLLGAWPVVGFMGADVALVWWAFRLNYARADARELIEVNEHELILDREIRGRRLEQRRFTRGWVQVELEEDRGRDLIGRLFLRSRGARTEIGGVFFPPRRRGRAAPPHEARAQPH